jgi:hypothetical protein
VTTTQGQSSELVDAVFDGMNRCIACHMHQRDIERVDELLIAGTAISVAVRPACGHTLIYRSVGMWTAAVGPAVHYVPK